jgi:NAD(P)H dehydrogenase (quinone)
VLHANTPFLRNHQRKASVEVVLRASCLRWTILQPSMYAQVALAMFGSTHGNTVGIPFDVDAEVSIIDLDDWAVVAMRTLLEHGAHDYASYELAGPVATMRRAVDALGRARGKELQACTIPVARGPLPPRAAEDPQMAADMISTYAHYDRHGLRGNPFVLTQLLGRPPATIEDVVAREYGSTHGTP